MPSDASRRLLAGDSASESDGSIRSGASGSPSCGGGAGCSGCEPRLAIKVVAIGSSRGGDEGDEDDEELDPDKSPRASGSSSCLGANQRRRSRVRGRAVLHASGGFSFRQDREEKKQPRPSSSTSNPFACCFSWLCGGGGKEDERGRSSFSYEVEASDLVGALELPPPPNPSSPSSSPSSSSSKSSFAPFSASRGRLPPLRPVFFPPPSSSPRSSTSSSSSEKRKERKPEMTNTNPTTREIVSRIRAAAAPWDNQLPSDPKRPRSALVVINPVAGGGKGPTLFENLLLPMLEAAGVRVEQVVVTREKGAARRAAAEADPSRVGALVAVGGDGTAAELLQGLMTRGERGDSEDAARRMPLAMLPAGSGNALVLSCCRSSKSSSSSSSPSSSSSSPSSSSSSRSPPSAVAAASVCATRAAAAIARGRSAPLDVMVADSSWEEGGEEEMDEEKEGKRSKLRFSTDGALLLPRPTSSTSSSPPPLVARRFAFLSLTYGLIANADVGTDPWRWMGPLRFTLGALREVAARRSHALDAVVVDASSNSSTSTSSTSSPPAPPRFPGALATPLLDSLSASALLPLEGTGTGGGRGGEEGRRISPPSAPWRRLNVDDAALFACCNLPFLDASTHLAPGVRRDCGSLHLVRTRGNIPRMAALKLLSEVETGSHLLNSSTSSPSSSSNSSSNSSNESVVVVDRVRALLLRPLDASRHGRLALDGEELPVGRPVACEVVPGGARLIVTEF